MGDWEQKNLVEELTLGMELAKQLQIHLNVPSSSRETREVLVQKILTSYEKALSMLNFGTSLVGELHPVGGITIRNSESPPSHSGSPRSEDSDRDTRDQRQIDYGSSSRYVDRYLHHIYELAYLMFCPSSVFFALQDCDFWIVN